MTAGEIKVVTRDGEFEVVRKGRAVVDVTRFLASLKLRGLSPRTRRAYAFDLVVLYRWLAATRRTLKLLDRDGLLEFIRSQREAGAHPNSINRRLSSCRLLFRFVVGRDLDGDVGNGGPYYRGRGRDRRLGLHQLPRRRPQLRVKAPSHVVEPLSAKEVRRFMRRLHRYRDLALLHLLLFCGLRSAEALGLELSHVSFDEAQLRVRGKGNKERVLPLPDFVARSLRDYLRWERPARCHCRHLFVVLRGRRRGRPMTYEGMRSLFRNRRAHAGLARANPHRFRHTFGADMARSGVRLPVLQRMMGHVDPSTTLRYIHLSLADVAKEYDRAVRRIAKQYETS